MSTPTRLSRSPLGVGDGKRIVLKEITADLHNSPAAMISQKKAGSEPTKPEHEVKVKFAREFIDAPSESISSASSFQSLASSQSTKSSSTTDQSSFSESITNTTVYQNPNVSGLDDLVAALSGVRLDDTTTANRSLTEANQSLDRTVDITRCIKIDKPIEDTSFLSESLTLPCDQEKLAVPCPDVTVTLNGENIASPEYQSASESFTGTSPGTQDQSKSPSDPNVTEDFELNVTRSPVKSVSDATFQKSDDSKQESLSHQTYHKISPGDTTFDTDCPSFPTLPSVCLNSTFEFKEPFPPGEVERRRSRSPLSIDDSLNKTASPQKSFESTFTSAKDDSTFLAHQEPPETPEKSIEHKNHPGDITEKSSEVEETEEQPVVKDTRDYSRVIDLPVDLPVPRFEEKTPEKTSIADETIDIILSPEEEASKDEFSSAEAENNSAPADVDFPAEVVREENHQLLQASKDDSDLDKTITGAPEAEQYEAFKPTRQSTQSFPTFQPEALNVPENISNFLPKRQSTGLDDLIRTPEKTLGKTQEELLQTPGDNDQNFFDAEDKTPVAATQFEKFRLEAERVAEDIINASLEVSENIGNSGASNELFRDPSSFDFFESQRSVKSTVDRLRESLFVNFDPLVSNVSMLPQDNTTSLPEERNGDKEGVPNNTTPKRNPAIAAIDRLLFYSPMPVKEEAEKIQETVEKPPEPTPVVDTMMAKELELVRSTVLQLEEQLQKEKEKLEKKEKENEEQALTILSLQEQNSQLQKRLTGEAEAKKEFNMVLDKFEKSMEDMVAARVYDKTLLEASDKELQETKNHLIASEAAFNDVHAKYERLKVVLMTMKSNETAWKEALEENIKTIKALDFRYEEIKKHASEKLEFANKELDRIEKKYAAEKMKLEAMLKKEELRSNSLADIVNQKTKENAELTHILDDLIARVGPNRDE